MNTFKHEIIQTFDFAILIGCSSPKTDDSLIVEINPNDAAETLMLSEIIDSIEYVKLETSEESIMSKVGEIKVGNKYIYCRDYNLKSIFIFNRKGKFISKLDRLGDGPDQYQHLDKFIINDNETEIEILDFRGDKSRIITYAIDSLEFKSTKPLFIPTSNSVRKEKDKNTYYFSTQQIPNEIGDEVTNSDIIVVNIGQEPIPLLQKKIETNGTLYSPNTESLTTNKEGEIYASFMFNNSFYRLYQNKVHTLFSVDFGKYSIDNSIGKKSTEEQKLYLSERTEGKASFPVLNIYDSRIESFTYYYKENKKNSLHHYIKFKKNNKIYHVKDIINDLTGYPKMVYLSSYFYAVNHEVLYNDYLVDIVLPWYNNEGGNKNFT